MRIQIDTRRNVIYLMDSVPLKELFQELGKMFPEMEFGDWKLVVTSLANYPMDGLGIQQQLSSKMGSILPQIQIGTLPLAEVPMVDVPMEYNPVMADKQV